MARVDLVIPVYNEERQLAESAHTLLEWCGRHPEHQWRIVVADNASTDRTLEIARGIEAETDGAVRALHIPVKGRGIALRTAWLTSDADVRAYMDVDLATDIEAIPALVDPIAAGEVDLAFGTRLDRRSQTTRGLKRETISRIYVFLLRNLMGLKVSDAQCGFKAISRAAALELIPLVRDNAWFFDSELLWVAQRNGYRLREVPVRWTDDPDSRVRIVHTAIEDLKGIVRLRRHPVPRALRPRETQA
ncbi:MAG: glycosyltransferase family 2 protein [Dehalococcoidia bacterium]